MVKPDFHAFLRFCKVPKMPVLQGFFGLLIFLRGEPCSRSQTSRATNCATPRFCIGFLSFCVEVGQTVVKPNFYAFLRFCKVPKMPVLQVFFALLIFKNGVTCSRSQTKRLAIGPHSEKHRAIIVPFFGGKVKRGRKGFAKRWLTKGEGYAIICTN